MHHILIVLMQQIHGLGILIPNYGNLSINPIRSIMKIKIIRISAILFFALLAFSCSPGMGGEKGDILLPEERGTVSDFIASRSTDYTGMTEESVAENLFRNAVIISGNYIKSKEGEDYLGKEITIPGEKYGDNGIQVRFWGTAKFSSTDIVDISGRIGVDVYIFSIDASSDGNKERVTLNRKDYVISYNP